MPDTQITAVKALTKIEEHIASCDRRYEDWQKRQDHAMNYLKDISDKLTDIDKTIAEAKGAAKMGKFIIGGISTLAGAVGGLVGHVTIK